jgi:hypothetical protein
VVQAVEQAESPVFKSQYYQKKMEERGWGGGSVVERVLSMRQALGQTSNTNGNKKTQTGPSDDPEGHHPHAALIEIEKSEDHHQASKAATDALGVVV